MDESQEGYVTKLRRTVEEMMVNVREMIATSKLVRARIESNDEVLRMMQNHMASMENRINTFERRLTKMENAGAMYRRIHPDA